MQKSSSSIPEITVFTDGGCINNPGPGGYGIIIIENGKPCELSGGFRLTTNNRMELTAAIEGLKHIGQKSKVTVYSDSRYLVDGISKGWAKTWRANKWRKSDKTRALNVDLWQQLLDLCDQHMVSFQWVEGHAGHPENERCDRLAVENARKKNLPIDPGYELPKKSNQLNIFG
ncbi:MAG: ribonuclease HI [Anaerolineae bacterium]|nr:ribonuclease HI [Anaerolineae bacterium]